MQRTDFSFYLPEDLIAQYPTESRTASRLLYVNQLRNLQFIDFPNLLTPKDLLVFNDTKVIPARLFGNKASGGKVEILVERILSDNKALVQIRASKAPKPDSKLYLEPDVEVTVLQRVGNFFELQFNDPIYATLERIGHIPLPPYIKRVDIKSDINRYQTVYAQQQGAVAAPTAGLHFDQAMLDNIEAMGVKTTFITLHVGAGTFTPMRVNDISQHVMHSEYLEVSPHVCELVMETRNNGGRVIAIGTTSVRALETASSSGTIEPYTGETSLFITPGYKFNSVDALLTNFHLPESTLLMLVCAFAGHSKTLNAYQYAVEQKYRFFSYGDAMFID
ncbi:tRNA preQ1(34) S-adenosylmethionine ribosyltransferase-isomerase QueA [Candidatus Halobeggiatoa sp. HSG11]|nr:tRNA preQ1(34) S-adenosylmethionine ribosyltransferase-isomerase QueA [Candidatus Halobeggiatoa sp. HSG11]